MTMLARADETVLVDIDRRSAVRALTELVLEDDRTLCLSAWARTCLDELVRYFDPAGDLEAPTTEALERARAAVRL